MIQFIPGAKDQIFAASVTGSFQILHMSPNDHYKNQFMHANINGYTTAASVSSTGHVLALGDSFGYLQRWNKHRGAVLNEYSRPLDFIDQSPTPQLPVITEDS